MVPLKNIETLRDIYMAIHESGPKINKNYFTLYPYMAY